MRADAAPVGLLAALLLAAGGAACTGDRGPAAPPGWAVLPGGAPDGPARQCANHAINRQWQVSADGDAIRLTPRAGGGRVEEPLPFTIARPDRASMIGDRRVARTADGWLVGFDGGEFGGSLWWFSQDGRRRRKLAEENVRGFIAGRGGTLALVGLDQPVRASGKILLVSPAAGRPAVRTVADLGAPPAAFALLGDGSALVASARGVVRVDAAGSVQTIASSDYGLLYPNSVAMTAAGVVYVGMRQFVTRLTPGAGGYAEEWLVPADCRRFELRGGDCVCR